MRYRLLIDFEVVEFLSSQRSSLRIKLRDCFLNIWKDPIGLTDYVDKDISGRPVQIHLCHGFAIEYWIDHADQHLKILFIRSADRS